MVRSRASRASSVTFTDVEGPDQGSRQLGSASNGQRQDLRQKRLIVAVDFGTTYSAVSYAKLVGSEGKDYLSPHQVEVISNYPNNTNPTTGDDMGAEVPTEILYRTKMLKELKKARRGEGTQEEPEPQPLQVLDGDGDVNMDAQADPAIQPTQLPYEWGYTVHNVRREGLGEDEIALSRFKLLLDESPATANVRAQLAEDIRQLKEMKIIEEPLDIIADYLTLLLRHTWTQLTHSEGINDSFRTELVLCVPAIWTQKACRQMQTAMATAVARTGFGGVKVQNHSIEDFFLVSEPEAAAAYVISFENNVTLGESFVLLDAGGGTVDANTYTVSGNMPLRLEEEVIAPGGGLYGSSFLNEAFGAWLRDYLRTGQPHLYRNRPDELSRDVDKVLLVQFETQTKKIFDYNPTTPQHPTLFLIPGVKLRDNAALGFRQGGVSVPWSVMKGIFRPRFSGVSGVMESQIQAALDKNCRVEKVVLIGGFASSRSLRKHIKTQLTRFCQERQLGYQIELFPSEQKWTYARPTAVSSGAVLRAVNKENGPRRQSRSSYGLRRSEEATRNDPPLRPEHLGVRRTIDRHDGQPYITNTIQWVIQAGDEIEASQQIAVIPCIHTFDLSEKRLKIGEVLYVADRPMQSHYKKGDPMNDGAERVGSIEADFTFLREEGKIEPVQLRDPQGQLIGTRHYRVEYELKIRVIDRDLTCQAVYKGIPIEECRINIAPAFRPGVK